MAGKIRIRYDRTGIQLHALLRRACKMPLVFSGCTTIQHRTGVYKYYVPLCQSYRPRYPRRKMKIGSIHTEQTFYQTWQPVPTSAGNGRVTSESLSYWISLVLIPLPTTHSYPNIHSKQIVKIFSIRTDRPFQDPLRPPWLKLKFVNVLSQTKTCVGDNFVL